MTPGPTSDSYDPEFGTGEAAGEVGAAIAKTLAELDLDSMLGSLQPIVHVVRDGPGRIVGRKLTTREWRIVRFAMLRALESL